jgi:hypothetical protein
MRDRRGIDHSYAFQFDLTGLEPVEEEPAVAEQDWGDVNLNFVEETGHDELLYDVHTTGDRNVFLARGGSRRLERTFNTVGYEGEGRSAFLDQCLPCIMCDDEHRGETAECLPTGPRRRRTSAAL